MLTEQEQLEYLNRFSVWMKENQRFLSSVKFLSIKIVEKVNIGYDGDEALILTSKETNRRVKAHQIEKKKNKRRKLTKNEYLTIIKPVVLEEKIPNDSEQETTEMIKTKELNGYKIKIMKLKNALRTVIKKLHEVRVNANINIQLRDNLTMSFSEIEVEENINPCGTIYTIKNNDKVIGFYKDDELHISYCDILSLSPNDKKRMNVIIKEFNDSKIKRPKPIDTTREPDHNLGYNIMFTNMVQTMITKYNMSLGLDPDEWKDDQAIDETSSEDRYDSDYDIDL
jgi:hypothetical protein